MGSWLGGGALQTTHTLPVIASRPVPAALDLMFFPPLPFRRGAAGESPDTPSYAFGWLMGASPDVSGGMMGTSPSGSYRRYGDV